jgi:hypothetical protein
MRSVMGFNELANSKPKAEAIACTRFRHAVELVEDPADIFSGNTNAPIDDQNTDGRQAVYELNPEKYPDGLTIVCRTCCRC